MVAHNPFPLHIRKYENQLLELMITDDVVNLLSRPVPVRIRWHDGESNPIFVCNRAALKAALEIPPESEHLQHIGDLDLDDKEFEELLDDLNEALIIDRRSIWRLAEQKKIPINTDDDRSLHLAYEDVNYGQLRRHPKIQQYLSASAKGQSYSHSRLQIILNAITAHFQAYESAPVALMQVADIDLEEGEGTSIVEHSPAIVEKQERTWSIQQRTSRILKQFIQRYLRGLYSPDFQDVAGSEVITKNYIIFHHLLWRLFTKDWVEPSFILDALLKTWSFFLGQETQPGYFFQLSLDEQIQAQQELEDRHNDAALIAAFYYCTEIAMQEHWEKLLFTLRDCWRFFLCQSPFPLLKALLTKTQEYLTQLLPYNSPSASMMVDQLTRLAQFETRRNFLRRLEASGSYPMDSFAFTKETIMARGTIECLQVRAPEALSTEDAARTLLQEWMLAERLDYYRIQASKREDTLKTTHMIDYDTFQQKGRYWSSEQKRLVDLGVIPLPTRPWYFPLAQMRDLATNM